MTMHISIPFIYFNKIYQPHFVLPLIKLNFQDKFSFELFSKGDLKPQTIFIAGLKRKAHLKD